jgi:hypothetical protein
MPQVVESIQEPKEKWTVKDAVSFAVYLYNFILMYLVTRNMRDGGTLIAPLEVYGLVVVDVIFLFLIHYWNLRKPGTFSKKRLWVLWSLIMFSLLGLTAIYSIFLAAHNF